MSSPWTKVITNVQTPAQTPPSRATQDTEQVKVLVDALRMVASPPPSPGLSLCQGKPFQLHCVASTACPLHIHLALLLELWHRSTQQSVFVLTHEGWLCLGPSYKQCYHSGDLHLDTVEWRTTGTASLCLGYGPRTRAPTGALSVSGSKSRATARNSRKSRGRGHHGDPANGSVSSCGQECVCG